MVSTNCSTGFAAQDGLCYNTSFVSNAFQQLPNRNVTTVVGFWNETLASENDVPSVLASSQYFQSVSICYYY